MKNQQLYSPNSEAGFQKSSGGAALWRRSPFLYTAALRANRAPFRAAQQTVQAEAQTVHLNYRRMVQSELI